MAAADDDDKENRRPQSAEEDDIRAQSIADDTNDIMRELGVSRELAARAAVDDEFLDRLEMKVHTGIDDERTLNMLNDINAGYPMIEAYRCVNDAAVTIGRPFADVLRAWHLFYTTVSCCDRKEKFCALRDAGYDQVIIDAVAEQQPQC